VEEASARGPRALGLFGEAGIGKSALLGATREQAQAAGMLVLEGRAAERFRYGKPGLRSRGELAARMPRSPSDEQRVIDRDAEQQRREAQPPAALPA
jgi:hypothetical protein